MRTRSLLIGALSMCLIPGSDGAKAQSATSSRCCRDLAIHRGSAAGDGGPAWTQPGCDADRAERAAGLRLSDRADADGGFGNRCRQGAGRHQRGRRRSNPAHRLAEHRRCPATAGAGHPDQRRDRQCVSARHPVSRLRGITCRRHAAGTCGVPERRPHQRSFRRHRQLGPDPDRRDKIGHRRDQQPRLRPQCAGRSGQRADEEWFQLPGGRDRHHGRLVRPHPEFGAMGQAGRQFLGLWRARRIARRRIPQFLGVARFAASTAMSATGPTSANFISTWVSPNNKFGASATVPAELLQNYWGATYTTPQTRTTGLAISI